MASLQQPKVVSKPEYGLLAEDFVDDDPKPSQQRPQNAGPPLYGGAMQGQQPPNMQRVNNMAGMQQQTPGMGSSYVTPPQQPAVNHLPAWQGQGVPPRMEQQQQLQQQQPYASMQAPGTAYNSAAAQQVAPMAGILPQQAAQAPPQVGAPAVLQQQIPPGSMQAYPSVAGTPSRQQSGYSSMPQQAPYNNATQQQAYAGAVAYPAGVMQQQQQPTGQPYTLTGAAAGMQQPASGYGVPPQAAAGPNMVVPQQQAGGMTAPQQPAGSTFVQQQQQQQQLPANLQTAAAYNTTPTSQIGSTAGGQAGSAWQPANPANLGAAQAPAGQTWATAGTAQPPQAGSAAYKGGQWAPAGAVPQPPAPAGPASGTAGAAAGAAGTSAGAGALPQLSRGMADLSLAGAPIPAPTPSLNRAGYGPGMQATGGFWLSAEITPAPVLGAPNTAAVQQAAVQQAGNRPANVQPQLPSPGQQLAGAGVGPNGGMAGTASGPQPSSAAWALTPLQGAQMPFQPGALAAGPGAHIPDNRRPPANPPPPMYSLELLAQQAAGQREVLLTDVQANDIIQQLSVQAAQTATEPPHMVDLADAHRRWMDSLGVKALSYIHTLETAAPGQRLPLNARPSLLQTKLKHGRNRLQDLVTPMLEPSQQQLVDLSFGPDGALLEQQARVWQCGLQLLKAEGVGPTGLRKVRQPCLYIARMALFDRANHCFLGNVCGIRPDAVTNKDKTWEFNCKEPLIVRCNCIQRDTRSGTRLVNDDALCIYIEFNTSHRLDIADTKLMPPHEQKAGRMVDEVTTCWAMLNFRRCILAPEMQEVSVPLYYGSLYDIQSLDAMYKAKRRRNPIASLLKAKHIPTLTFRAGPVPCEPPPALPYGFMPTTMIAKQELGTALAAYRVVMALQLCRQTSLFSPLADPVLSAFPGILSDSHILTELLLKWQDGLARLVIGSKTGCCGTELLPPIAMVVELFRQCVSEVSPLLRCATLPPRHINNFVEYQGHRLKLVQQYCHQVDQNTNMVTGPRHPVEPLSHAGFEFLHKPFNVTETRVCLKDGLEGRSTFIKAM